MELNGRGVAAHLGQPTGTTSPALCEHPVEPAAATQSPADQPPETVRHRRTPGRPAVATSAGRRTRLLDLRPGDCVCLPVTIGEPARLRWSAPGTITSVLLIDTELVQVRWSPEQGQDPFAAHLLLTGPAYHAGAVRYGHSACWPARSTGVTRTWAAG